MNGAASRGEDSKPVPPKSQEANRCGICLAYTDMSGLKDHIIGIYILLDVCKMCLPSSSHSLWVVERSATLSRRMLCGAVLKHV